ncbi:MAG: nucleotidyltransferase domain-containing protein [Desulfobacterales bacterium]
MSDIDVAVLPMPTASDWELMRELKISAALNAAAGTESIQILNLRKSSIILQMEVLKTGRLIYCRNEILYADFVEHVTKRYCDFSVDYREIVKDFDAGMMEDFK